MQDAFKAVILPNPASAPHGRGTRRSPDERTAAMTAAIFLISLNLLLVGSLAIRKPE
jgi:hypothetical protein